MSCNPGMFVTLFFINKQNSVHTLIKKNGYSIMLTAAKHSSIPAAVKLTIKSVLFSYSIPVHVCNFYSWACPYHDSGNIPPAEADRKQSQATEGFNTINPPALHRKGLSRTETCKDKRKKSETQRGKREWGGGGNRQRKLKNALIWI